MIEWKKYDPLKPPIDGRYIILNFTDAHFIYEARYVSGNYSHHWRIVGGGFPENVTHYAEINLPDLE